MFSILAFLVIPFTILGIDNESETQVLCPDSYSVESRLLSVRESTGYNNTSCDVARVEHTIYRTDCNGQKWFFSKGVVEVSNCWNPDEEPSEPIFGSPFDPACPSTFHSGRFLINDPVSQDYGECFVDFAVNEENNEMLLTAEADLIEF